MTYDQLEQFLDEDLAWRKKEISELYLIYKDVEAEVLLKSLILLLYAHWEGYIKKSSKVYLKYIVEKKVQLKDLQENFKAVALKANISRCISSEESLNLENELSFMDKYLLFQEKKFKVGINPDLDQDNSIIDTQSNLKPKILANIFKILGLSFKSAISTREHYIDTYLIRSRNTIGHGSKFKETEDGDFDLKIEDITKLKDIIFSIIDCFQEELLEYAHKEFYLICNKESKDEFIASQEEKLEKIFSNIESAS